MVRRDHARRIYEAGIRAVDPRAAILKHCSVRGDQLELGGIAYDLTAFRRIWIVGAGKAGAPMAGAMEELLGERVTGGLVCVKYGHGGATKKTRIVEAGHPIPDKNGLECAEGIVDLVSKAGEDDLIVCVISGGGSALTPLPAGNVTLEEKGATTRLLLECGATIHEINAVRKHLSRFKGGNLARASAPATLISLILSDVIGDDLDVIASGPTVPDRSTFRDCLDILEKYELTDRIPTAARDYLRSGEKGVVRETPKPGEPVFRRTQNVVVGCNLDAVSASAAEADSLGYRPVVLSSRVQGETREAARVLCAVALEVLATGNPVSPPACILSGGETTVKVTGGGLGGRNMEFVLASAIELDGIDGVLTASVGTDGTDGPTDAAGAFWDLELQKETKRLNLDPRRFLENNDSYRFFDRIGGLVRTGPTRTNVMDLRFFLVAGSSGSSDSSSHFE